MGGLPRLALSIAHGSSHVLEEEPCSHVASAPSPRDASDPVEEDEQPGDIEPTPVESSHAQAHTPRLRRPGGKVGAN